MGATAAAIDQQSRDPVRDGVQRGPDDRKRSEPPPVVLFGEAELKSDTPRVQSPSPVDDEVGMRRLHQSVTIGVPPAQCRQLPVQHLDGPVVHDNRVRWLHDRGQPVGVVPLTSVGPITGSRSRTLGIRRVWRMEAKRRSTARGAPGWPAWSKGFTAGSSDVKLSETGREDGTVESGTYVVPFVVLSALVASVIWVLRDARAHVTTGRPVAMYVRAFQIEQPEAWACACLVMWVLFFPLYLMARSES